MNKSGAEIGQAYGWRLAAFAPNQDHRSPPRTPIKSQLRQLHPMIPGDVLKGP